MQATTDTCRMMGNRIFINHIIADEIQRQGSTISDTSYITCMRDFMQYSSHLDELPAYLGGRENTWRSLSLRGLSRNILQWDSLEVGGKGTVADRLKQELLLLAPQVPCPLIGGAIPPRMLRSPAAPPSSVHAMPHNLPLATPPSPQLAALADQNNEVTEKKHNPKGIEQEKDMEGSVVKPEAPQIVLPLRLEEDSSEDSLSDSEWEEEAEKLCSWTRQLALDDMDNVPPT
ncbi:unnamed protein product [Coregonus sp. 'balchen']|nr:unnamed protein product [Coregonus sp. 'balchen']